MALNEFTEVDFLSVARDRVTELLKDKDIFDRYLQLLLSEHANIQQTLKDLMQLRSIDTAVGAQLDIIGDIVGQDRILISADQYEFFGFQGALKAGSYGNLFDPSIGARWRGLNAPTGGNVSLDDETYRLFIRAKILKNTITSSPEEFIQAVNLIFKTQNTIVIENPNGSRATAMVLFNRPLTDFEKGLLYYVDSQGGYPSRLIPKTVGVQLIFGEYVRTDPPIGWTIKYDGVSFVYDYPYTYNSEPIYSERFDESNIEITLY